MTAELKIVELHSPAANDIPEALRLLANEIEKGEFGDAHNLAWVVDCGNSRV